jgi:type IV secretory pathway component VirB8
MALRRFATRNDEEISKLLTEKHSNSADKGLQNFFADFSDEKNENILKDATNWQEFLSFSSSKLRSRAVRIILLSFFPAF